MFSFVTIAFLCFSLTSIVLGASRTSAPTGALIVRAGTTTKGEFSTLSAAVASLASDGSSKTIFIFPGTYNEQVYITRTGPLTIFGYTTDTTTYTSNQVTIQAGVSAAAAGNDDASGTLRIHKDDFKMYNVNVKNTFGQGSQALAISQYGTRAGLYACAFYGYQDTVLVEQGVQVFLKGYIQGAVDFIFGQRGEAYFGGNVLAISGPGTITASGRSTNDNTSYVFNQNTIVTAAGVSASTVNGKVFLGRPWSSFAKVIFKNTAATTVLAPALWEIWSTATPNTGDVLFADYDTTGSGAASLSRASFATELSSSQASAYSISSAVGSDYATWVDTSYVV